MRWCLILVLLVVAAAVHADPVPPALPADALPQHQYSVSLTIPGVPGSVNSSTTISYEHNAPTALSCALRINGTLVHNVSVARQRAEQVVLHNGSQQVNVTCSNASMVVTHGVQITVVNETSVPKVIILHPGETAPPSFTLIFRHTAPQTASCNVTIDGIKKGSTIVAAPNTNKTREISFAEEDWGEHELLVTCLAGGVRFSAMRETMVSDEHSNPDTLNISPKTAFTGMEVKITGEFEPYEEVQINITTPTATREKYNKTTTSSGKFTLTYTPAKVGSYKVNAVSDSGEVRNGTFTVTDRDPTIMIIGNVTNVTADTPFVVVGTEFLPNDNVTVSIIGGGASVGNTTTTDAYGGFEYVAPRTLTPRQYTITARSKTNSAITDTITITVLPKPVQDTPNTTPNNTWTPPDNGGDDDDTQTGGSDTDVNNDDFGFDDVEEPEPYYPPADDPIDPYNEQPAATGGMSWLYYLLLGVLVVGGALGYFVYNGTIDLSGITGKAAKPGAQIDYADEQTIKSFIFGERGKGFDDLTIRSALITKGWEKDEVDRVFDKVYKN